jgi:hypothetical protein
MEPTPTEDNRLISIVGLFDLQTPLFNSVLDGISDKDAHNRLGTKANHIAWLAGSLTEQRYELANLLTGSSLQQSAHSLFAHNAGIKDGLEYPSLEQFKQDWKTITPIAREGLVNATAEKLDSIFKMPEMQFPYYELIKFTIYREANCIGQIALWRRLLGYEPMKYM